MEQTPSIVSQLLPLLPAFAIVGVFAYFILRRLRKSATFPRRAARPLPPARLPHLVFAKIMDTVCPMEHGSKYEDPLDDSLREHDYGFTTGGGTQMDKSGGIAWIGIDIELRDLDGALAFTRDRLREIGAPPGSVLQYRVGDEQKILEIV